MCARIVEVQSTKFHLPISFHSSVMPYDKPGEINRFHSRQSSGGTINLSISYTTFTMVSQKIALYRAHVVSVSKLWFNLNRLFDPTWISMILSIVLINVLSTNFYLLLSRYFFPKRSYFRFLNISCYYNSVLNTFNCDYIIYILSFFFTNRDTQFKGFF